MTQTGYERQISFFYSFILAISLIAVSFTIEQDFTLANATLAGAGFTNTDPNTPEVINTINYTGELILLRVSTLDRRL
jgi:hypothetical protein